MTEWIVLAPAGDTVEVRHAEVDEPTVLRPEQVEGWARVEAARRAYEEALAAAEGASGVPSNVVPMQRPARVEADESGEVHVAAKLPGPRFTCFCPQVFDTAEALAAHRATCGMAKRHRDLDGHAEKDGFKWGET